MKGCQISKQRIWPPRKRNPIMWDTNRPQEMFSAVITCYIHSCWAPQCSLHMLVWWQLFSSGQCGIQGMTKLYRLWAGHGFLELTKSLLRPEVANVKLARACQSLSKLWGACTELAWAWHGCKIIFLMKPAGWDNQLLAKMPRQQASDLAWLQLAIGQRP